MYKFSFGFQNQYKISNFRANIFSSVSELGGYIALLVTSIKIVSFFLFIKYTNYIAQEVQQFELENEIIE